MRHHLCALPRGVLRCAALLLATALPALANTTYTNLTTAPVAGNSVLILDTTVAGGASSLEAQEALNLGFDVVVNDTPTWLSMTTANFATFRAIILGDPSCQISTTPIGPAVANRTTWSPAVKGNMIIIGTDPAVHPESSAGLRDLGLNLTRRGIAFATNNPAKTGAYITLSCYYTLDPTTPQVVPLLDQYGTFTLHGSLGCYNNAHIVATAPALTGPSVGFPPVPLLLDSSLAGWSCSLHEGFDSWPPTFSVFAIGQGLTSVYTATDGTVGLPYILVTGEKVQVSTNISLTPNTASNPVNTSHTLTATISPAPPAGTVVTFTCTSGPNAGVLGTALTNAFGVATLTYTGSGGPGTDFIIAQWTDPATGATYTSNTAQKTWDTCTLPEFTITGPTDTCKDGTYCVTPAIPGAIYHWNVTNAAMITSSLPEGPCIGVQWNPTGPGLVSVTVNLPGCPPVTKEIYIKPCEQTPKDCCEGVKFITDVNGPVAGPKGTAALAPYITVASGLGNITRVVATIVTTDQVFSQPACGPNGPVNSYFTGWGPSPGFNASMPHVNGREMVWTSIPPGGVNLSSPGTFPMAIQFPPPPKWPCNDAIRFCIRYEFTDVNCKTCEVTVCYTLKRKGAKPHLDTHLSTGVAGTRLPMQPVVSVRDEEGNVVTNYQGSATLRIVPGTGAQGAKLSGRTTVGVVNGYARFTDLSIDLPGADYILMASLGDSEDPDDVAVSNPFNISLIGSVPIVHTNGAMVADGQITPAEWNGAPALSLGSALQKLPFGNWSGTSDYSATVQLKWDEDNLYFAAVAIDDDIVLPTSTAQGLIGADALEIFLGVGHEQHNLERVAYEDGEDFDILLSAVLGPVQQPTAAWCSPQKGDTLCGTTDHFIYRQTGEGYVMEGRIPWSLLDADFHAAVGTAIGFNLQGVDVDTGSPPPLPTTMSLTGLPDSRTRPRNWTLAFLLGPSPGPGDVNGDGVLDATDVQITAKIAGGLMDYGAPGIYPNNADADGNGSIDLRDALQLDRRRP